MIIRQPVRPQSDYVSVPNAWARDERLSRRARGLLAELLSHADGWQTSVDELVAKGPEGRDAINATLRELKTAGYLVAVQGRADGGRMGDAIYTITAPAPPHTGLPYTAEPSTGEPRAANPHTYKKTTRKKTTTQKTSDEKTTEPPRSRAATSRQISYLRELLRALDRDGELLDELEHVDPSTLTVEEADRYIRLAKDPLYRAAFRDGGSRLGEAHPELRDALDDSPAA